MKKSLALLLVLCMMFSLLPASATAADLSAAAPVEAAVEPVAEEPVAEEPVVEEAIPEEPVAEEPAAAEPVAEEPAAEEAIPEEPAQDGAGTVSLTIEKRVYGFERGELPEGYSVTFTAAREGADPITVTLNEFSWYGQSWQRYYEAEGTIDLPRPDSGSYSYTITESAPVDGYSLEKSTYRVLVQNYGGPQWSQSMNFSDGRRVTVEANTQSSDMRVENTYTDKGSLTITKTVEGLEAGDSMPINTTFTVTNAAGETVATVPYWWFFYSNSYTIKDLPAGTYTVTESGAELEGKYALITTGLGEVTVTAGETTAVTVTNSYAPLQPVTIYKEIYGLEEGALPKEYSVTFTVTDASGKEWGKETYNKDDFMYASAGTWGYEEACYFVHPERDSVATIMVPGPGSGVPSVQYTVTETGGEIEGYSVTRYVKGSPMTGTNGNESVFYVTADGGALSFRNRYTKYGGLTITKAVEGLDAGDSMPDDTTFTVTNADEKTVATVKYSDFDENGSCTIEGLPAGSYTVTESGAEMTGYTLNTTYNYGEGKTAATVEDGKATTVEVTNSYSRKGSLTITKTFAGLLPGDSPINLRFTVTGPDNDSRTVYYSAFTDGSYTIEDLAPGEYTVKEDGVGNDNYANWKVSYVVDDGETKELERSTDPMAVTVPEGNNVSLAVTNTYTPHYKDFTVRKIITGLDILPDDAAVTVNVYRKVDGAPLSEAAATHSFAASDFKSDPTGLLASYTFEDLPYGNYLVTETVKGMEGYVLDEENSQVEVSARVNANSASALLKNVYTGTGSLTIQKTLEGLGEIPAGTVFTVENTETGVEITLNAKDLTSGEGTYSKTITLPAGSYTVTESGAEAGGYTLNTTYSSETVTVEDGKTAEITVTNTYTKYGNLTITKKIEGLPATVGMPGETAFTVANAAGETVATVNYSEFTGGSYTIQGLPAGEYTVTESNADVEGYRLNTTYSSETVTVKDNEITTVTVTNTYTKYGNLTITKKIEGLPATVSMPNDVTFTVTGPDNDSRTVNYSEFTDGSYTIQGLPAGEYTIAESNADVEGYRLSTSYEYDDNKTAATVEDNEITTVTVTNLYQPTVSLSYALGTPSEKTPEGAKLPDSVSCVEGEEVTLNTTYATMAGGGLTIGENTYYFISSSDGYSYFDGWYSDKDCTNKITQITAADEDITVYGLWKMEYPSSVKVIKQFIGVKEGDLPADTAVTVQIWSGQQLVQEAVINDFSYAHYYGNTYEDAVSIRLPFGSYTVTEKESPAIGGYNFDQEVSVTSVNVDLNQIGESNITLKNHYVSQEEPVPTTGSLKISKEITGLSEGDSMPATAKFLIFSNETKQEVATVTYGQFVDGSYTVTGLAPGIYYLSENDADVSGYFLQPKYVYTGVGSTNALVTADEIAEVKVINTYTANPGPSAPTTGSLKITKAITGLSEGDSMPDDTTFTVTNAEGKTVATVNYSDFTNGSYTLTDLPAGDYTVTESNADVDGYTLSTTGLGEVTVTAGATAEVKVTNTYTADPGPSAPTTGSLKISKEITGLSEGDSMPDDTTFTVTNAEGKTVATVNYSDFTNGSYTLTDLPAGDYTVTESNADVDGYTLSTTGLDTVTVTADETAEVKVTNTYAADPGPSPETRLVYAAIRWSDGIDEHEPQPVQLYIDGTPEGDPVELDEDGDSHQWTVPAGEYTLQAPELEGYELRIVDVSGTFMGSDEADVSFIVWYSKIFTVDLDFSKTVEQEGNVKPGKNEFTFFMEPIFGDPDAKIYFDGEELQYNEQDGGYYFTVEVKNAGTVEGTITMVGSGVDIAYSSVYISEVIPEDLPDSWSYDDSRYVLLVDLENECPVVNYWLELTEDEFATVDGADFVNVHTQNKSETPAAPEVPGTGDNNRPILWALLAMLAAGGLGLTAVLRRKKARE